MIPRDRRDRDAPRGRLHVDANPGGSRFDCIGEAFPSDWRETIGEANPGVLRVHAPARRLLPHQPQPGDRRVRPPGKWPSVVKIFIPGLVRRPQLSPARARRTPLARLRALCAAYAGHGARRAATTRPSPAAAGDGMVGVELQARGRSGHARVPCHVQAYEEVLARPRDDRAVLEWIGLGGDVDAAASRVLEAGEARATSHAVRMQMTRRSGRRAGAPAGLRSVLRGVRDGEGSRRGSSPR